jgi:3-oxoacyl-[acyl-carrier protein] reductase
VNAVAPVAIETELVARMYSSETRRVYRRTIPLFGNGTRDETAAAIVLPASRDAGYLTAARHGGPPG